MYPLPPPTGVMLNPVPGPRTHDGMLTQPQEDEETAKTFELLEEHIAGKMFLARQFLMKLRKFILF